MYNTHLLVAYKSWYSDIHHGWLPVRPNCQLQSNKYVGMARPQGVHFIFQTLRSKKTKQRPPKKNQNQQHIFKKLQAKYNGQLLNYSFNMDIDPALYN